MLLGWVGRGGHNIATFLPREEPDASHAGNALGAALVTLARRRGRAAVLVTIDGVPAIESTLVGLLGSHGFRPRHGALVYIPPRPREGGLEGRRGEQARLHAARGEDSADVHA